MGLDKSLNKRVGLLIDKIFKGQRQICPLFIMYHSYSAGSGISQYYIMEKKDGKWTKSSMYIGSAIYLS